MAATAEPTRAERIARIAEYAPDVDTGDMETLEAVVGSTEKALATIDGDALLSPGEQLAVLAVALVRGFLPMVRGELEHQITAAEAKLPQANDEAAPAAQS